MPITPSRKRNRLLLSGFISLIFWGEGDGGMFYASASVNFFLVSVLSHRLEMEVCWDALREMNSCSSLMPRQAWDTGASAVNQGGQALPAAPALFPCTGRKRVFCSWEGLLERAGGNRRYHSSLLLPGAIRAPFWAF